MKKNLFISLVSFMIISILGIVILQGYWIFSAWNDKEKEFSLAVQQSLMMVADEIQERELSDYITAYENLNNILKAASHNNGVDGIVFGRVDFAGSLGESRDIVDSEKLNKYIYEVAKKCKSNNLDLVVGGAVSIKSIQPLKHVNNIFLSRFETRKVIFNSEVINSNLMEKGLEKTIYFELLWLQNKRDYYDQIKNEDSKRIEMLQSRWDQVTKR